MVQRKKYAGITRKTHSQNTLYSLFCLICDKSISVEHQGKADLLNSKRAQRPTTQWFVAVGSDLDKLASATKVKVTGFLTENNLLFTTADNLGPLFYSGTFFQIQRLQKRMFVEKPKFCAFSIVPYPLNCRKHYLTKWKLVVLAFPPMAATTKGSKKWTLLQ